MDSEAIYRHLFAKVPAQLFHNLMLAYEFLQFCRQNVGLFAGNLSIFRQSTPNLFKVSDPGFFHPSELLTSTQETLEEAFCQF